MALKFLNNFSSKQKYIIAAVVAVAIIGVAAVAMGIGSKNKSAKVKTENTTENKSPVVVVENDKTLEPTAPLNGGNKSPLSGLPCENYAARPFAVMMAGDTTARPLSGLSEADIVFEMPVITSSITRLMGVFTCNKPAEMGSLRSARHDYITLAMGIDAIFVHWGGSHFALDDLKKGIADDIDALKHSGPFFRKSHIPRPHNGFTSYDKLVEKSKSLKYRLENKFAGYPHFDSESAVAKKGTLDVGFAGAYKVKYEYDPSTNSYKRFWNGIEDKDYSTGKNIMAKNVVVMKAASRQIEGQYNDVDIEGEGEVKVYRNGEEISGKWKKDKSKRDSKLFFLDSAGEEIKFVPGQIWVEIIEPHQEATWKS